MLRHERAVSARPDNMTGKYRERRVENVGLKIAELGTDGPKMADGN